MPWAKWKGKKPYECIDIQIPESYTQIHLAMKEFRRYFRGGKPDLYKKDSKLMAFDRENRVVIICHV